VHQVSERNKADRNTALAFTCKGSGAFPNPDVDLHETLELFFATLAVTATTPMMATAAATLANGGVNPLSGDAVFDSEVSRGALSLMLSSGMYDSSGEWAFDIGLPAKSSISGALMVVIPNVLGMCVYSPLLSDTSNLPLKGIAFTKKLVETFAFHHLDSIGGSSSKQTPTLSHHMTDAEAVFAMICAAAVGDVMALQRLISAGVYPFCYCCFLSRPPCVLVRWRR
jgi:glutaminase